MRRVRQRRDEGGDTYAVLPLHPLSAVLWDVERPQPGGPDSTAHGVALGMPLAYRSGMTAPLDLMKWRLELLRGISWDEAAESQRLIAESACLVERVRQICSNDAAQTQPPRQAVPRSAIRAILTA